MKIYIAGKVSNNNNYYLEFCFMEKLLKREGFTKIVNPVRVMESVAGFLDYQTIINADLELLENCDAVIMLPNWKDSNGAIKAYNKANRKGLKIFEAETLSEIPKGLKN